MHQLRRKPCLKYLQLMVVGQHGPRGFRVASRVEKARGFVPARAQILFHKMAANHVTTQRHILSMDHVTCRNV